MAINNNYAQHLCVAMASILKNKNKTDRLCFHILSSDLSQENKNKIYQLQKIAPFQFDFVNVSLTQIEGLPINKPQTMPHAHISTYYRLFLASLLPDLIKVIFLDSDLVVECTLSELWNTTADDCYFAGVRDVQEKENCRRLCLKKYCNAGVLLINLDAWRQADVEAKFMRLASEQAEKLDYLDQDILNWTLQDRINYLPLRYNAQVGPTQAFAQYNQTAYNERAIIHYVGKIKPWHEWGFCYPFIGRYLQYLALTPFTKQTVKIKQQQNYLKAKLRIKEKIKNFAYALVGKSYKSNLPAYVKKALQ